MGWIKIDRSIVDHWIWSDEKKLKWWLTILLEVNYSDRKMSLGYNTYEIKRGQSSNSIRTWANIFKSGTKSVVMFFNMLEKEGLITKKTIGKGKHSTTLVTVCKYDSYDYVCGSRETQESTQESTQKATQEGTLGGDKRRKEERKESKNVRSSKNIPTLEEVIQYVVGKGYDQSIAEKFHAHYQKYTPDNARLWRDKYGKTVKDWKGKLNHVWFRDEEKRDESIPVLPAGHRFLSMSEAHRDVRELTPTRYSEADDKDMFVRKEMDRNKFYTKHGEGWTYKPIT